MKVAIYARVSTERQERDQTVASQVATLTAWAGVQGHELADEHRFIDEGYSGARLDRPALDRLRDAAQEGTIEAVAVLSPDRLARTDAYQVLLLEELRRHGCRVIFLHHPISDDPNDHLLLQIQGAIAADERAVIYERFRRGRLQKARAGHYLSGSNPPYGYRYIPKRDGLAGFLVIHDAEAELVRQVYRWLVDDHLTGRQIVKRLNASDWRPRSGKAHWALSVVHNILTNPIYTGTAYANRTAVAPPEPPPRPRGPRPMVTPGRRRCPPEEWVAIPTPVLIDQPTDDLAQAQLARNATRSYRHAKHNYLLRCLLRCGTCGLAMTGDVHAATARLPEYRYDVCSGKDAVRLGRDEPCPRRSVKADDLEAAVWDHLRQLLAEPGQLLAQFQTFAAASLGDEPEQAEARRLALRIERLRREEQRLVDAYQAEVINLEELAERRQRVVQQREALLEQQEQRARLHHDRLAARAVLADITAFCARVRCRLETATFIEQQAILQLLIERIIVGDDTLEIRHVIPLHRPIQEQPGPDPPDPELRSCSHVGQAQAIA